MVPLPSPLTNTTAVVFDLAEVAPSALRPVTTQPIWGSGSPSLAGNASGFWIT